MIEGRKAKRILLKNRNSKQSPERYCVG